MSSKSNSKGKYKAMESKLFRSGGGWGLFINSTILKLLKIDPEKDKVEYIVENDTLKIKKVNTEEK